MKYYIVEKSFFYNASDEHAFVKDEDSRNWGFDGAKTFNSKELAEKWVADTESEIYRLAHNEAGRPVYKVLDEDAAWRFHCVLLHEDLSECQYDWDHCDDPNCPTDDEIATACEAYEDRAWEHI